MSSPIPDAEDLDPALMYAPPWVRDGARKGAEPPPGRPNDRLPASRRGETASSPFVGDRAMHQLQRRLALEPDKVPAPPLDDTRTLWPIALRICGVAVVAAVVAWGMLSLLGGRNATSEASQAEAEAPIVQPPVVANPVKLVQVRVATAPSILQNNFAQEGQPPTQPAAPPVVTPQPDSSRSDDAASPLSNDEIVTLVKRGKDLLTNGNLAAARLLLRRAADAGSAEAALALGATFDPFVIQRLGAVGAEPDVAQAGKWYQKAADLGSQVASGQLARLAQARQ
jgi:hypothetical protein